MSDLRGIDKDHENVNSVTIQPQDKIYSVDGNKGTDKQHDVALAIIDTIEDEGNVKNESKAKRCKTEKMATPADNDDCIASRTRSKVRNANQN